MKLQTLVFGKHLKQLGFDFYSGVPCSFLSNLINYAINEADFVMASNEGDAVATCAGAYLAGKKSVALMQNSGLTNATSPLSSLNFSFKLPVLGFVSLRGEPGLKDEPQHELMGVITEKMLELLNIKWTYLSTNIDVARQQLNDANKHIANNNSFFFVVKKDTFDKVELKSQKILPPSKQQPIQRESADSTNQPTRLEVLETLNNLKTDENVLLATTGKTGRELYEVEDAKNNFYMVGSMGCISSLGLGLALNAPHKKIIAIDGDGAFLMRMGNIATNAYYQPKNFLHLLIDNNAHDSTGGQFTVSSHIDFVQLAASCGYTHSIAVNTLTALADNIAHWMKNPETTFVYIKIKAGSKEKLGRPSIKPYEVKERLMAFIHNEK